MIGKGVDRVEDARLLRGEGIFVSDINLPGLAHAAVLRSPHAYARIARIDASSARSIPGVLAVATFYEVADIAKPIPQLMPHPNLRSRTPYPLAKGLVKYVGEPVAMVVAENAYLAKEVVERIEVEYELLEPVIDTEAALLKSMPLVHQDLLNNIAGQFAQKVGDVNGALAMAHITLCQRLSFGRISAQPLETRAIIATYQLDFPKPVLTVWWSTQGPHNARRILADQLNLSVDQIRVIAPNIGGGFGVKNRYYPEDTLVPLMAMRLRRPVKWLEDRAESFVSTYHAGEQIHEVTLGLAEDGTILALRDRFIYDQGAYTPLGVVVPHVTSVSIPGPYRVPNYAVDCTMVFTNKTPTAPYRGAGKPQATFVMERMLDFGARALKMDPVEIRRRNLLQPEDFAYNTGLTDLDGTPVVYDSGYYQACLERAMNLIGYTDFRTQKEFARGMDRHIGIGMACFIEMTGRGPFEGASIRVEPSGRVMLQSGISSQGQGHETTLAQVCAEHLGARFQDISVVLGDTAGIEFGVGTYAGRVAVMAGNAVAAAAKAVREKAITCACKLMHTSPDDLMVVDSWIRVRGAPEQRIALGDIARSLSGLSPDFPRGNNIEPGLHAVRYFQSNRPVYTSGTYVVIVEVNPDTGAVQILNHAMVYDCGVRINPRIVESQICGGIAQGISSALFEEVRYDEFGTPLTISLRDYFLPTATEIPSLLLDHVETPSPFNPLGVKGVGECGTIPAAAAVMAAIEDALENGVPLTRTPIHPLDLHKIIHTSS